MMRRKALSLCSYAAAANNGITQSLERGQSALLGSASRVYVAGIPMLEAFGKSKLEPGSHQGVPVFSKLSRGTLIVSSFKSDFQTQKWVRSFSTYSEPAEMEKTVNASVKRTYNGPGYFTASGAVVGKRFKYAHCKRSTGG